MARYIGPIKRLKGCTAILRRDTAGRVWAQFDFPVPRVPPPEHDLLHHYCHGWKEFMECDFEPEKIKDNDK